MFPKKYLQKIFLPLLLTFSLLFPFFQPTQVFACEGADCFSTSYDITFKFDSSGRARVKQTVTFKNKTEDNRIQEYGLTIGSTRVSAVSATDRAGVLAVTTKKNKTSTTIKAIAKEIVVGLGKTARITINYTIDDLAIKHGLIWEVNLPKVATPEQVDSYQLSLIVPKSFGPLHSITPDPASSKVDSSQGTYKFGKADKDSNISALFGSTQQFKLKLKYRLKNNNLLSALGTIALPPDTDQQQILISRISPQPKRLYLDGDGNYLAEYSIKGRAQLEIEVEGFARLSDQTEKLQTVQASSEAELKKYLVAQKYWEVENSMIQKKAKELKTARNIYNYVTSLLKYNYQRLDQPTTDRFGAVKALQQPTNAICTDYTDLFIALARAAGIPARELEGYAYTDNTDTRPIKVGGLSATNILHAWPQYYDQDEKRWIAIDPTWGSTTGGVNYFDKLDTNHIVFAIHGLSSQTPIPAGGYKITGAENDDLEVSFAPEPPQPEPRLEATFNLNNVLGGLPSSAKVTIKNPTGQAILRPKIYFEVPGARLNSPNTVEEEAFLPFESKTYDIKLNTGSLISTKKQSIKVAVVGFAGKEETRQEFNQTALVKPFFLSVNPVSLLSLLGLVFLFLIYPPIFNKIRFPKKLPKLQDPE
ncbi:MAG: transglutaminase-like domain-containing protein [bacterium]|nr:transglutaminase-like domain-containing protein [bacterium]